jgi:hypothetical protein
MSDKPDDSINFYYELDQGLYVGSDGSVMLQEMNLTDSNAGIPLD